MCSESSADINHIHRHRGRLPNVKECVPSPRSAKGIQKVDVKGRGHHATWRRKPQNGPSVSLGADGVAGPHLSQGERAVLWASSLSPRGRLILRELLAGILGGKALAKYQVLCLSFRMLCFHVLACFLGFPVGLAGPPSRWPLHKTG